jgi:hypothetical protein
MVAVCYELMSIYYPEAIKLEFLLVMQSNPTDFMCPCGSTSFTELNIMTHFRQKHFEANKAYLSLKSDFYPFENVN